MTAGVITGMILAMVTSSIIFIKNQNKKTLNFVDWFIVSLGIFYGIGQSFVSWNTANNLNSSILGQLLRWDWYAASSHLVAALLAIISVYLGHGFAVKIFRITSYKKLLEFFEIKHLTLGNIRLISWGFLFISIICYLLYAKAYGGLLGLLNEALAIRSNMSSIENSFSFLQRFGGLALFASFLFQGLLLEKRQLKTPLPDRFGLLASFFWSLLILISWMGRVAVAIYISTLFIGKNIYKSYHKAARFVTLKIIIFFILGCLLIPYIGLILERNTSSSSTGFFTSELTFPFVSWETHQDLNTSIRWFKDLAVTPVYFLPEKIWTNWIHETASAYNTRLIPTPSLYGEIPTDYLTFTFLQGGWVGIVLCSFIWGGFLYFIEELIKRIKIEGIRAMLYTNVLLNLIILTVLYSDSVHLVRRLFYLFVGFFVLSLTSKLTRVKIFWTRA